MVKEWQIQPFHSVNFGRRERAVSRALTIEDSNFSTLFLLNYSERKRNRNDAEIDLNDKITHKRNIKSVDRLEITVARKQSPSVYMFIFVDFMIR